MHCYRCLVKFESLVTSKAIIKIFCLYDHYLYGDHAVLALGYMEFEYKKVQSATKSKYSRYLRIADGWSSSPNRFVHVKVGHKASDRGMITVHPKK